MKKSLLFLPVFIAVMYFSCQKEISCETCIEGSKPPIAVAGPDQVITLPTDSVSLDGSASNDPDGRISEWLWTKISGPASFNIVHANDSVTKVKNLVAGVYRFELKVTDDGGLIAKDTVQVTANNLANRPPVANAGADTSIALPANSVTLDGSGSSDPDNNITTYTWTKISGSSSFNITNANAVQTQVADLVEGVYQFELKVTDASGLFSRDTMWITVIGPCNNNNWPMVNATLTPIGNLSEARNPAAGATGYKIVFAGGWKSGFSCCFGCGEFTFGSSVVDVYDVNTRSWQTHQLSNPRLIGSSVSVDGKIFFAGGTSWVVHPDRSEWDVSYDNVDIYNVSANKWEVAHLSKARQGMAAAVIGNKVLFAGGTFYTGNPLSNQVWDVSNVVDIYDLSTKTWSATTLSVARAGINAVVIGDKIYFAGGYGYGQSQSNLKTVDIYDYSTNTWSASDLQVVITSLSPPSGMGLIDRFYIGGDNIIFWSGQRQVGIRNLTTGATSTACISYKPAYFIDDRIVFFNDVKQMDMYDPATGIWSIGSVTSADIPA